MQGIFKQREIYIIEVYNTEKLDPNFLKIRLVVSLTQTMHAAVASE